MANKKKSKKSSNKGLKLFIGLIIVIGICVLGFLFFRSFKKTQSIISDASSLANTISEKYEDIVTESNLDVVESNSNNLKVVYKSSNEKYLSNKLVITRPKELTGDVKVTLNVTIEVINLGFIDAFVFNLISKDAELDFSYNITIKARKLTDEERLEEYLNNLYIPNSICSNMDLPTNILDASCTWVSSNKDVLLDSGEIKGSGNTKLSLTLNLNGKTVEKEFNLEVKDELIPNNDSYDFASYDKTSYSGEINYEGIIISNGIRNDGNVKFKVEGDLAYINTDLVKGIYKVSFNYQVIDDMAYTKKVSVALLYSETNSNYEVLKEELITDNNIHNFEYNSLTNLDGYFKILLNSEYSSRTITIDDLVLYKNIGIEEAYNELLRLLPKQVSGDVVLPFTTSYGGKVTYESNDSHITNLGKVTRGNDTVDCNVKVKLVFLDLKKEFNIVIKVNGLNTKEKVEIRFIDLSKFGGYLDCGESTYIKYGDYDILIDGGDDYKTTVESVEYVLNEYSNDKILDLVVATHPDSDHIGGLDSIIIDYKVLRVLEFYGTASTKVYENYHNAVEGEDAEVCKVTDSVKNLNGCTKKIDISSDGEVYIDIMDTTFYEVDNNNARSVVFLLHVYGYKVLFTGDADNGTYDLEKAYMAQVGDIDILKVVHHGTSNGTTSEFIKAVDPEVAIICNGNYFGNKNGHPTYEAIKRLYDYDSNMKVYAITGGDSENCTLGSSYKCEQSDYLKDRNGTITIIIDNNGYTISSEYYNDNPIELKDTNYYQSRLALDK